MSPVGGDHGRKPPMPKTKNNGRKPPMPKTKNNGRKPPAPPIRTGKKESCPLTLVALPVIIPFVLARAAWSRMTR